MTSDQEWTTDEFEVLLQHPALGDEEVARMVSRSEAAVGVVRKFVHSYHKGGNVSGLSRMMVSRLQEGGWTCPGCDKVCPPRADPRGS